MRYLTEKQKAEIRQMQASGFARHQERKIRDLARDLRESRVPAARPEIRAALAELAIEIIKALSPVG